VGDPALAIDEQSDSTPDLLGELRKGAGELGADELGAVDAALVEGAQGTGLRRFEAVCVAVQRFQGELRSRTRSLTSGSAIC